MLHRGTRPKVKPTYLVVIILMSRSPKRRELRRSLTVEIEHCCNCEIHLPEDRHSSLRFQLEFDRLKNYLRKFDILVKKKPVPAHLVKRSPYCLANIYYNIHTDTEETFPQIGAFEVYYLNRKIFSRLKTKKWPDPDQLTQRIYSIALDSRAFHATPFAAPPADTPTQAIETLPTQDLMASIDLQHLATSKRKYQKFKQKLKKIQGEEGSAQEEVRPRTTNVRRSDFQPKPELVNRRPFYSRDHQSTNEEGIANAPEFIIKVRRGKSKQSRRASPEGEGMRDKLQVYLQSLQGVRGELESQKERLRKKLHDNLRKQQTIKKEISLTIRKQASINPDNLEELLNSDLFD